VKTSPAKLVQIKAWRKAHPENVRRAQRKWDRANPESGVRKNRKWREKNLDRERVAQRDRTAAWKRANPEAVKANHHRRRARKLASPGAGITAAEWAGLKVEYGGRCAYCARARKLQLDHIDPLSKGGAHEPENAAPACQDCNFTKHDKSLLIWLATSRRAAA
jgi:5-methylcytosine-specific restriction endonuclease McrA